MRTNNMTKKNKLTIVSVFAATSVSALVAQISLAQPTQGCIKLAPVGALAIGQAVARTCADNSGTGSAKLLSQTATTKKFNLVANLKDVAGVSASSNIVNSGGVAQCAPAADSNPSGASTVAVQCSVAIGNAGSLRVLVGDGVGP
jgi:hypothetical protein